MLLLLIIELVCPPSRRQLSGIVVIGIRQPPLPPLTLVADVKRRVNVVLAAAREHGILMEEARSFCVGLAVAKAAHDGREVAPVNIHPYHEA